MLHMSRRIFRQSLIVLITEDLEGAAAVAESLQSCPTLSDPRDGSPPGSSVHGIFQARVLGWGAIAFSIGRGKEYKKE